MTSVSLEQPCALSSISLMIFVRQLTEPTYSVVSRTVNGFLVVSSSFSSRSSCSKISLMSWKPRISSLASLRTISSTYRLQEAQRAWWTASAEKQLFSSQAFLTISREQDSIQWRTLLSRYLVTRMMRCMCSAMSLGSRQLTGCLEYSRMMKSSWSQQLQQCVSISWNWCSLGSPFENCPLFLQRTSIIYCRRVVRPFRKLSAFQGPFACFDISAQSFFYIQFIETISECSKNWLFANSLLLMLGSEVNIIGRHLVAGFDFKLFQMQGDDYTVLLQGLQRSINCLTDQDRNIRRSGLATLLKELERTSKQNQIRILTTTNLCKNLLYTLGDPIEANRELTLSLLEKVIANAALKKQQSDPLVQGLIQRVNNSPFPEKSEDLREKIIQLLRGCLAFKESLAFHIAELASALAKCLLDPKAEIKNKTSELINDLSAEMKGTLGKYSTAIAKALVENLKNNKYAVRKNTLITLGRILITEGAGGNFEHVQVAFKVSLADPKAEVRKAAFECAAYLLKYMAPKFLKQYEAALVSCLLAGLSDEQEEIVKLCMRLLEECGESIRQMEGEEAASEEKS